jgi:hypothetical protein
MKEFWLNNKYQIIWLILAAVLIPVKTNAAIDEAPRFINALAACIEEKTVDEAGYARACMLFKDGSVTCWSSRGYVVVRGRYVSNIAVVYRPPQELGLRVP